MTNITVNLTYRDPITHKMTSTPVSDSTPDAFSITPQTNVSLDTDITSAAITVVGYTSATISITGGTYSIDGGAFTSSTGTINIGQVPRVKLHSSATGSTSATATLTIGGVSANFVVTTISTSSRQLAVGFFEDTGRTFTRIYPRPDAETASTAYHRVAYTGMQYEVALRCQFGSPPYYIDSSTFPSGAISGEWLATDGFGDLVVDDQYLNITWPTPVAGTQSWSATIKDQAGTSLTLTWSTVTGTSNHYFCAVTATGSGNGSSPSNCATFANAYNGSATTVSPAKDKVLVCRGGNYTHDFSFIANATYKPIAIVAYPGESPIFDGASAGNWQLKSSDAVMIGLKLKNYKSSTGTDYAVATDVAADRQLLWKLTYESCNGNTAVSNNEACWYTNDIYPSYRQYSVMSQITFINCYDICAFDNYAMRNCVYDRHVWTTDQVTMTEPVWFPKGSCVDYHIQYMNFDNPTVENVNAIINIYNSDPNGINLCGGVASYNFVRAKSGGSTQGIGTNQSSTAHSTNSKAIRNTLISAYVLSSNFNITGPSSIALVSNGIQNNPQVFEDGTPGSAVITNGECQQNSGVFDSNGRLTGTYATNYNGKRSAQMRSS